MRYFFLVLVMFTAMMFWNLLGSQDRQHKVLNAEKQNALQQPTAINTLTPPTDASQTAVQERKVVASPEKALDEPQRNNRSAVPAHQPNFTDNSLEALVYEQGWNMADVDAILDSFSEEDQAEVRHTLAEVLSN